MLISMCAGDDIIVESEHPERTNHILELVKNPTSLRVVDGVTYFTFDTTDSFVLLKKLQSIMRDHYMVNLNGEFTSALVDMERVRSNSFEMRTLSDLMETIATAINTNQNFIVEVSE